MRIRVIQKPALGCIDGVDLDRFQVGMEYEVGSALGNVFLAEKWGIPAVSQEPSIPTPLSKLILDQMRRLRLPPNVSRKRERFYPDRHGRIVAAAADTSSEPRRK